MSIHPKLTIDVRMIEHSGIGRFLQNILPGIIESKIFNITLLGSEETISKHLNVSNLNIINMTSKIYSIKEQLELYFKAPYSNIFWSPHYIVPIFPINTKKRIVTIHDVYHLRFPEHNRFHQNIYAKYMFKSAVNKSDLIVTDSIFSKNEIIHFFPYSKDKIKVIYCGINKDFNVTNEYIDKQKKYLLFVGNIKQNKNLVNALLAYEKIYENYDIDFYVIGEYKNLINKDNKVYDIINKLGNRVKMLGHVKETELKKYYSNAIGFIFPSYYEGFGLPILEAMSFNIPILCSNKASMPEIGGNVVTYFNPFHINEISKKIKKLFDNKIQISQKDYKMQLKKFRWDNSTELYIKYLVQLLK